MNESFSSYQRFVLALLAFLQFTVILDFMILSPLGPILMEKLSVAPSQFGLVVSAYAISAGISGFSAAAFADRFDRRKLLLFFYTGFVLGTLLCGIATSYEFLLVARIVTGIFGGVIGSIVYAIAADLFPVSTRGRVMGVIQTSFAASQILGIPLGLFIATHWGWHATFLMIVGVSLPAGGLIVLKLQPITLHLAASHKAKLLEHLVKTATEGRYIVGFSAMILLATGGYMLMPFGATFLVQNLGVPLSKIPAIYTAAGLSAVIAGPILGRLSDSIGKYRVFVFGSAVSSVIILWYTRLSHASLAMIIALNVVLFIGISARMASATALNASMPELTDRGAYMAISSSLQQLVGGVGAWVAGLIVHQSTPTSPLEGYPTLGVVVAIAITVILMFNVQRVVTQKVGAAAG